MNKAEVKLKLQLHLETLKNGEQLIRIFGKAPNRYEPAVEKYLAEREARIAPPDHVTLPAGELYDLIVFLKHNRIDFYIS